MPPRTGRLAVVAGALTCVALAGCASSGSSQPSASGSSAAGSPTASASASSSGNAPAVTSPSGTSTPAGAPACATSSLNVKQGASSGYAGGVYVSIDFTNTSGSTCTLFGYPGVSLVTGPPYTQIGLAAKRTPRTPPELVTLAPGATANAVLQIVNALNYPSATCSPTKATALKIYPPNQTEPVYLPSTATGCDKPVQTMFIAAVRPAAGRP
jgi:hypothetical protein